MSTEAPVRIAVTGVAGQICYGLLFQIASGSLLGDQPIRLRLLEIAPALKALEGVVIELGDCVLPGLKSVVIDDDPKKVFDDINLAMLAGTMPRKAGTERDNLLSTNGAILAAQGRALSEVVADDVHVLVTDDLANTNALVASSNAPNIPKEHFNAPTRLDHNRAKFQLVQKLDCPVEGIKKMTIWGNHSSTQYPDIFHAKVDGENVTELVDDEARIESTFIPTVAKRGAAITEARGLSSAAFTVNATVRRMRDRVLGTPDGNWVSMAIPSDGPHGVAKGVISSFPCVVKNGRYEIVQSLKIGPFSRTRIDVSVAELLDERKTVKGLGLI